MRRAYEANAAAAAPTTIPASEGYPSDGDPANLIPATIPGAWWFHAVTEAVVTVIEQTGEVPSDSVTQFRDAVLALVAERVLKSGDSMTGALNLVTPSADDNSKKAVNSEWVRGLVAGAIPGVPDLSGLATRTYARSLIEEWLLRAGGTMTGALNLVTPGAADNSKKAVNSEWVRARLAELGGGGMAGIVWNGISSDIERGEVRLTLPQPVADYARLRMWYGIGRDGDLMSYALRPSQLPVADWRGNSRLSADGRNLVIGEETSSEIASGSFTPRTGATRSFNTPNAVMAGVTRLVLRFVRAVVDVTGSAVVPNQAGPEVIITLTGTGGPFRIGMSWPTNEAIGNRLQLSARNSLVGSASGTLTISFGGTEENRTHPTIIRVVSDEDVVEALQYDGA